jgi:6-pyruvoyltetrahydropterin/6-carboxytetrahydropterin synthase
MRASRKIHFCSGHRVYKHESKCATPHGHNYVLWVYAEAPELDSIGRVIDFSVLKEKVGKWVDENWDHTFLVYEKDLDMLQGLLRAPKKKKPFVCDFNPTAENMAEYILKKVGPSVLHGTGVKLTKVVLYETENCFAEVEL